MANVLIVAYLLIVLALITVILLQRSEGGGLGMGGGGGGGFMTARGSANLLTRTTAVLATLFFATAIGLTLLSQFDRGSSGILERAAQGGEAAPTTVLDALNSLSAGGGQGEVPVDPNAPNLAVPSNADPVDDVPAGAATVPADPVVEAPANATAAPVEPTAIPGTATTGAPANTTVAPADGVNAPEPLIDAPANTATEVPAAPVTN